MDRTVNFAQIRDGSSNTLVAGDKRLGINCAGANCGEDNEGYAIGWDGDIVLYGDKFPMPDPNHTDSQARFGSAHPGGFNALFGDGAVHFIPYTVELEVFARMCHRSDSGVYAAPF